MGFSHSGNEALIKSYREGIEQSIEIIAASPWFPEAVKMLAENPNADVGVHLALTSEWESVKWRPLTCAPSLTDPDGYFFPMIWPNKNYGKDRALSAHEWKPEEVEREFRAQIELVKKKVPGLSHISAHMGCTDISPITAAIAKKLAAEYQIDIDTKELGVKQMSVPGPRGTTEEKITSFIAALAALQPGETYLFVEHPGLDGPELRSIYHIGNEDVASARQGVTDLFTDKRVKDAVKKYGIELIAYRDLKKTK